MRPSTRELVVILDFRGFATATHEFSLDDDASGRSMAGSFSRLPSLLPRLRCVLLDGHGELDPKGLVARQHSSNDVEPPVANPTHQLLQLSLVYCDRQLPTGFLREAALRSIVYLDVSYLPGGLGSSLTAALATSGCLPHLRILKARGRELDDAAATQLFEALRTRAWSLDISDNKVTDAAVDALAAFCFPPPTPATSVRSDAHFAREGKLIQPHSYGSDARGPFHFIVESEFSGNFDGLSNSNSVGPGGRLGCGHPERYFVDAPVYRQQQHEADEARPPVRGDGHGRIRDDSEDAVKTLLSSVSTQADLELADICREHGGITHLHISNNRLTAAGVTKLLLLSQGHLELLDCGGMFSRSSDSTMRALLRDLSGVPQVSPSDGLFGLLGQSHLFRPAVSSNLRRLRIHHSVITSIPTVKIDQLSEIDQLLVAEDIIGERAAKIYPLPFVPDMNPRLTSLTLTDIPRFSSGLLIERLVHFLKLASLQERSILESALSSSRRAPRLLAGLRHLRLEFADFDIELPSHMGTGYGQPFSFLLDGSSRRDSLKPPSQPPSQSSTPTAAGPRSSGSLFRSPSAPGRPSAPTNFRIPFSVSPRCSLSGELAATPAQPASSTPSTATDLDDGVDGAVAAPSGPSLASRGEFVSVMVPYLGRHPTIPVWTGPGPRSSVSINVRKSGHDIFRDDSRTDEAGFGGHADGKNAHEGADSDQTATGSDAEDSDDLDEVERRLEAYAARCRLLPPRLRAASVGPATPSHVAAGVPEGRYIFLTAWEEMLVSPLSPAEKRRLLQALASSRKFLDRDHGPGPPRFRDVAAELRRFRAQTRAAYAAAQQHQAQNRRGQRWDRSRGLGDDGWFWTGRLELVFPGPAADRSDIGGLSGQTGGGGGHGGRNGPPVFPPERTVGVGLLSRGTGAALQPTVTVAGRGAESSNLEGLPEVDWDVDVGQLDLNIDLY